MIHLTDCPRIKPFWDLIFNFARVVLSEPE
jgi:hypothetical protein